MWWKFKKKSFFLKKNKVYNTEEEVKNFTLQAVEKIFKILTENTKTPLSRAKVLASFLGSECSPVLSTKSTLISKDHMAFGSVLGHNQHNIGLYLITKMLKKKKKSRRSCFGFRSSSKYVWLNVWCWIKEAQNNLKSKVNFYTSFEIAPE
jgi:predicted acetyltransferase